MITVAQIKAFFLKLEDEAETDIEKGIAVAGQFLRSTATKLAHDPVLLAAIQAGFDGALAAIGAAVTSGGAAALPAAAIAAGKDLLASVGHTANDELVPIVIGELHAAYAPVAATVPEKVNN